LKTCLAFFRRETIFQAIPEGARVPMMRYAFVDGKTSIEQALEKLDQNDVWAMLQHARDALGKNRT
jgi:hypothetical protein